ncbi:hypothetical protein CY34DRAFT_18807 [Suillus luteus UH-Slu-Lm8-n1]|uniref:Cytosol aminopeptidase domain-containing protein n=1 Tax=Suillus luteus UH-Slu-Lm8-n1 TaxID=930992 RepID=A0A0D0ALG6_9AGAM|nr:hypothetical protein CY34DRAFT_18807 [Suillus luteus UH-Slu-Lm8-n1]
MLILIYFGCRINVVAFTPLCENLPGPKATKPGDVIYAMNGKSVEVDNTDAEGRLVLADALYYASTEFKPHTVIDVATLTGAMDIALGEVYTGVFTTSDALWNRLSVATTFLLPSFFTGCGHIIAHAWDIHAILNQAGLEDLLPTSTGDAFRGERTPCS